MQSCAIYVTGLLLGVLKTLECVLLLGFVLGPVYWDLQSRQNLHAFLVVVIDRPIRNQV